MEYAILPGKFVLCKLRKNKYRIIFLKLIQTNLIIKYKKTFQMESGYVNFELKLPRGASVGLYARRNALPTHTNYDLMEVIKGLKDSDKGSSARSTRALKVSFVVLCSFYEISN